MEEIHAEKKKGKSNFDSDGSGSFDWCLFRLSFKFYG